MTVSQNYQEAQLLLETLETQVKSHGFQRELSRSEELFNKLSLDEQEKATLATEIEGLKAQQDSWKAENSLVLKQELESAFSVIESALEVPEQTTISEIWDNARQQLDGARQQLESIQSKLKSEGRNLAKADQDACWQRFKDLRKIQKKNRQNISSALINEAEAHLTEAEAIVKDEPSLRLARENFQVKQRLVNQMPLWREQRQRFHKRFNDLWNELQARSKSLREDRQQRQEEGLQQLEEALARVQQEFTRKEEEFKLAEDRYNQAHWHEVDPIEKQLGRNRKDLEQTRRKKRELEYKINDIHKRAASKRVAVPTETSTEVSVNSEMPSETPLETTAEPQVDAVETAAMVAKPAKVKPKQTRKEPVAIDIPEPPPTKLQQMLESFKQKLASESTPSEPVASDLAQKS